MEKEYIDRQMEWRNDFFFMGAYMHAQMEEAGISDKCITSVLKDIGPTVDT